VEPKNGNQPSQSAVTPASKMDIGRITYEWTNRTVTVSGTITVAGTVKLYHGQHEIILGNPEAVKIPSN
jgi:DNA/RNA endonuclease YhcR with UshA esterase domain